MLSKDRYQKKVFGVEIYHALNKSNQISPLKNVLIGDSVGLQLFDSNAQNDTLNSLASNQAISLAGQYILLHNYVKTGNKFDKAFLYYTPFSFINNLDEIYTYNYFIKPFNNEKYKPLFNETVKKQINKIPYHQFSQNPLILTCNWTPKYVSKDVKNYYFVSPISAEYLKKIFKLAEDNNFEIVLLSPPISSKRRKDVEIFEKTEVTKNGLDSFFQNYFKSISYLDESEFIDGVHLKEPKQYQHHLYKMYSELNSSKTNKI